MANSDEGPDCACLTCAHSKGCEDRLLVDAEGCYVLRCYQWEKREDADGSRD